MPDEHQTAQRLRGVHVLLAGGGSGGHVFPALAVADQILREGGTVSFAGAPGGMEATLVPARGFTFHPLTARPVVGKGPLGRVAAAATLAGSALRARNLVRRLGASVVLGTGGYVSAPAALGARLARRPVILVEPNAAPGAANRFLSRWARGACVAFADAGRALRCPVWLTGVPVRAEFFEAPAELPAGPLRLLVVGGSQGARQLNLLLPEALELLKPDNRELVVVHQCGEGHLDTTRAEYSRRSLQGIRAEVLPFLDPMARYLAESHLVVCRAGAITLAELAAAGRGSILIPLELAEGHQRRNAEALETAGAARVLAAAEATGPRLAKLLAELLDNPSDLQRMATAARALARPDAAAAIAGHLAQVAA